MFADPAPQQRPSSASTVTKHSTGKRSSLSSYSKKTLGAGNLRSAVQLPANEEKNEWLAANIVDFFNEISLLYGLVADDAQRFVDPGTGFPPGYEYRWMDGVRITKPKRCSSPEYVDYVMSWVEEQINDESVFPVSEHQNFPDNFGSVVKTIFKRLFRVFAIVYHRHFKVIEKLDATRHLNTCCKHFIFFSLAFQLLDPRETAALKHLVDALTAEYASQA